MKKLFLAAMLGLFCFITTAQEGDIKLRSAAFTVPDASGMNAIPASKLSNGTLVYREDVETIWVYDADTWKDTGVGSAGAGGDFGIVASGNITLSTGSGDYVITHSLGYVPDFDRVFFTTESSVDIASSAIAHIKSATTTTLTVDVTNSPNDVILNWAIFGTGAINAMSGGIVAEGTLTTSGTQAIHTVTHSLGYAPDNTRIQLQILDKNGVSITPEVENITTTTFDINQSSTTNGVVYAWRIFGADNATPQTGSEIESSLDTELANIRWKAVEVPAGGTTGQVLEKADNTDYNVQWATASGSGGTPDDDSVTAAKLADGDFGDWSVSTNVATLDNDVVAAAEMADADHGDISWSGGVASIDPNTVTSTIISNETILSEDIATDAVTGSEILNGTIEEPDLEATNAPTDNQILSFDSASNGFTWVNDDTGGSSLPVADGTSIAEGSADATKEVRFEVDGLTTATTRVITMPDKDVDLDDFVDVTISGRTGTPVTAIMEQTQAQYDVDGDPPAGTVVVISDAASADSFTGTAIPLDGYYQRDDTTTDTATWTLGTSRNGGSAEILINLATEPTVTGSTVITGSEAFQANTLSVLTVKNFSGTVKHWFTSL